MVLKAISLKYMIVVALVLEEATWYQNYSEKSGVRKEICRESDLSLKHIDQEEVIKKNIQ